MDFRTLFRGFRFSGRAAPVAKRLMQQEPTPFVVAQGQRSETEEAVHSFRQEILKGLLERAASENLQTHTDLRARYGILDRFTLRDGGSVTGAVVHQDETGIWVHTTAGVVYVARSDITGADVAD